MKSHVKITKIGLLLAVLGVIAAWLVVPEFRTLIGLDTPGTDSEHRAVINGDQVVLKLDSPLLLKANEPYKLFKTPLVITYFPLNKPGRSLIGIPGIWSGGNKIELKIVSPNPISKESHWVEVGDIVKYEDHELTFLTTVKEITNDFVIIE